jgi:hypothetical protein
MTTQGIRANRRNGETLDAFGMHIMTITDNLRSLEDTLEDLKIVQKFLSVFPDCYSQMACSMD